MIERIGTIKNPLTIIGIFAAISEISGTAILPFISSSNQATYMWFLIIFPVLLIVLFFITLNFNHRVLYAPSDFKNEDNFVRSLQKVPFAEKALQDEAERAENEEISSASAELPNSEGSSTPTIVDPARSAESPSISRSLQTIYALAEEFIFRNLSQRFTAQIQRDVRVSSLSSSYIFDGIVHENGIITVITVKLLRQATLSRLRESLMHIYESATALPQYQRNNFRLILAMVVDAESPRPALIDSQLKQCTADLPFPVEVYFYKLSEIERQLLGGLREILHT